MTGRPLRILHAIHDFLPRHQAGSELYAAALCRALSARHDVTVAAAEYDPARPHGSVTWRMQDGLRVAEIVNNWAFDSFAETYRSASLHVAIDAVLRATAPHVVHVHSLLNLSFDLPALARAHGAAVVATLHEYTLVCPSGGQRVHRADAHVCHDIDPERCVRCFAESAWAAQMAAARLAGGTLGGGAVVGAARAVRRFAPRVVALAAFAAGRRLGPATSAGDVRARLDAARDVLAGLDLAVAPSAALARELHRFGLPLERTVVADYGFEPLDVVRPPRPPGPLRIGFVGTLVWHKGAHVLLEAVRALPRGSYEVRIAGDPAIHPDYAARLRTLSDALPVTFTGPFDRGGAADVYAAIDVLVVPSLWPENSPLVIHEAFMAGVPVIGARAGGIPELVADGVSGLLFDASNPATLTAALGRVIAEPALLDAMRQARPGVRSIDEDAAEWEARYRALARVSGPATTHSAPGVMS